MCGCNNIIKTTVNLNSIDNQEDNLIGFDILTTTAKAGKVIDNIISKGEIIGYIVSDNYGKKFNIFRNEILHKNK